MAGDESFELPPAEHPVGIYVGLIIAFIILAIGSMSLFLSLYNIFKENGLTLSNFVIFRLLVMFASFYAAFACLAALSSIIKTQQRYVRKIDKEFRDFITYARPLVEEIIRQRIIAHRIADELEEVKKMHKAKPSYSTNLKWYELLILVAILANISVGLYLHLINNPWTLVPYSVIILALAWYFVFAWYFDLLFDVAAFYIPAIYIVVLSPLSIILRAYIGADNVVYLVFLSLAAYVLIIYAYYSYLAFGTLPTFIPAMLSEKITKKKAEKREEQKEAEISKLKEFLPEEEEK